MNNIEARLRKGVAEFPLIIEHPNKLMLEAADRIKELEDGGKLDTITILDYEDKVKELELTLASREAARAEYLEQWKKAEAQAKRQNEIYHRQRSSMGELDKRIKELEAIIEQPFAVGGW